MSLGNSRFNFGSICVGLVLVAAVDSRAFTIAFAPLSGNNGDPYNGHLEGNFTITPLSGTWTQAQLFGNFAPDIFSNSASASLGVTDHTSGLFTFSSVDLGNANSGTNVPWSVQGLRGGVQQFLGSGTFLTGHAFTTEPSPNPNAVIDSLVITMSIGTTSSYNIDNIVVNTVTPEPAIASLCAAGALLLGRRRRA